MSRLVLTGGRGQTAGQEKGMPGDCEAPRGNSLDVNCSSQAWLTANQTGSGGRLTWAEARLYRTRHFPGELARQESAGARGAGLRNRDRDRKGEGKKR